MRCHYSGGRKYLYLCTHKVPDFCLFIFQSDTASVEIPELELELSVGTLGGLVTTVEGLLTNISQSKLLLAMQ